MRTRFDPELSRLAFEDRLIEFCEDPAIPLLERVRLMAILADRLDVFFMTRVGRLKRLLATGEAGDLAPAVREQLSAISAEAHRMMRRTYALLDELMAALAGHGIAIERWDAIGDEHRRALWQEYGRQLAAVIRTAIVDPGRGFPHVRNLRPALFARGHRRGGGTPCTAVVELPAHLPRLVPLPGGHRFVPLEQIIAAELPSLCPDIQADDVYLFRVTRNAETALDDDDDVLESVEEQIVRRPFQDVVRIEVERSMPRETRRLLYRELETESGIPTDGLDERDIYDVPDLLDLTGLEALGDLDLPALRRERLVHRPVRVDHLLGRDARDELLHFPFDDYETSIERFLVEAAKHPDLESMCTTIYRTDRDSDVVAALREARSRGAAVNAVIELKASFDERDNIELTRTLESEDVRVVLSPPSLKVHAKVALVTMRRGGTLRRVALIGTGNMNATTARSYVDLWIMTPDPVCTGDVAALFDLLTGDRAEASFACLMVSPFNMRSRFLSLIERETDNAKAGAESGIRAMMNGLTDPAVMTALNRASQAGVGIELMVRGVCLLRPGAPGISENIRIVSVAGHLLQHARVFHFRNAGRDEYYIGSADWRPRNFDRRIEVVTGIQQDAHRARLDRMLTGTLATPGAWVLGADGVYARDGGHPAMRRVRAAART